MCHDATTDVSKNPDFPAFPPYAGSAPGVTPYFLMPAFEAPKSPHCGAFEDFAQRHRRQALTCNKKTAPHCTLLPTSQKTPAPAPISVCGRSWSLLSGIDVFIVTFSRYRLRPSAALQRRPAGILQSIKPLCSSCLLAAPCKIMMQAAPALFTRFQ